MKLFEALGQYLFPVPDAFDLIVVQFLLLEVDQRILLAIDIPTLEGKVKIKIDPGTQPGKILRLRGKGLPDVNGYGRGDLLVSINVWIPKNLSKEEKKTIEKFIESPNFTPAPDASEKSFFQRMKNFFEQ